LSAEALSKKEMVESRKQHQFTKQGRVQQQRSSRPVQKKKAVKQKMSEEMFDRLNYLGLQ
jgi:sarcosine oxidase delta subunit